MADNTHKGKGWFGDSVGHSKAGRKGGLARSKKNKGNINTTNMSEDEISH